MRTERALNHRRGHAGGRRKVSLTPQDLEAIRKIVDEREPKDSDHFGLYVMVFLLLALACCSSK